MKERPIDTIQLTAVPGHALSSQSGTTIMNGVEYVHYVFINGTKIWSDGVYFSEFEEMLNAPGDYWPFVCSFCGEAGCVDIFHPVRCRHRGDFLILAMREPLQESCVACTAFHECPIAESKASNECSKRRPHYHAYLIQKEQLRQQLEALYQEFGDHLGKSVW